MEAQGRIFWSRCFVHWRREGIIVSLMALMDMMASSTEELWMKQTIGGVATIYMERVRTRANELI